MRLMTFTSLDILQMKDLIKFHLAKFMFQLHNALSPPLFDLSFIPTNELHNHILFRGFAQTIENLSFVFRDGTFEIPSKYYH